MDSSSRWPALTADAACVPDGTALVPLLVRMWTQPAPEKLHLTFTREPDEEERSRFLWAIIYFLEADKHDGLGPVFRTVEQFAKGVSR